MNKMKTIQKFTAMMLSVIMVVCMMPVSATAETGAIFMGKSGEILTFEVLPADIAVQNVPLGTSKEDLTLPENLIATVRFTDGEDESVLDSEETFLESETESDEAVSGGGLTLPGGLATTVGLTGAEDESVLESEETFLESEIESDEAVSGVDAPAEITISLPVVWISSLAYDGETVGEYIFTPVLPEGFTVSAVLPQITVTVGSERIGGLVIAFEELSDDIRWQNTPEPNFPEALVGIVEEKSDQIPVTWQADHDYDAGTPQRGLYVFMAQPEEGYVLEEGLEAPRITVYIPENTNRMTPFRMGGGGTVASPLEITTPEQLREIAVLVGTGRLESFLFNDANATVSLKLINDIDLYAYGQNFNDGKGWEPIGNNINPFKGKFDGNSKTITGLYINRTTQYTGLFGFISSNAYIKNLWVLNADVTGGNSTGIVVGELGSTSTLEGCYVTGVVSGATSVGGVAGRSTSSSVKNCRNGAEVDGSGTTGGVVGSVYGGSLSASYSVGAVSGGGATGGVVGSLSSAMLLDCYATGAVNGGSFAGGVAGNATDAGSITQRCAALNPAASATGTVGRVLGHNGGSLLSNIAFSGMSTTVNGVPRTIADGEKTTDGFSMNAADIKADGTLGGRFSTFYGWVRENGKLPGFGEAEEMPGHITEGSDLHFAGEGTAANPYQISTPAQLKKLADLVNNSETNAVYGKSGLHYKLMNNLDLSDYGVPYNGGKGWKAIGNSLLNPFRGVFDGNGKLITGLYINNQTVSLPEEYAGLFGCLYGTVRYLSVVGDITGRSGVGLIAGELKDSAIVERCFTDGKVHCLISDGGGIVGTIYGEGSKVQYSYSTANVSGKQNLGGIAGRLLSINRSAIVQYCYSTGIVTGEEGLTYNIGVGGIVGGVYSSSVIVRYCTAMNASLSGTVNKVGRVVGCGDPSLTENYAFEGITVNGVAVSGGAANDMHGSPKTATDLQTTAGFPIALTSGAWHYIPGSLPLLKDAYGNIMPGQDGTLPYHISETYFAGGDGSVDSPYLISTADQLAKLAELVNVGNAHYNAKHYRLISDIDLSAYGRSYNDGKGWEPIGLEDSKAFKGHFDGNGKVVTGLYISQITNYTGLFGYISQGTVRNLGIAEASIKGTAYVGCVAGVSSGSIQGCYVTGSVSGTSAVGGIVGYRQGGSLENCYSSASVSGSDNIGGVAGVLENGNIQSCYAIGLVSGPSTSNVGGIVGRMQGIDTNVENCAALNPSITLGGDAIGRVVGHFEGTLGHNYAFTGMTGTWENRTHDGIDGADMTIAQANSTSFWGDSARWSAGAWNPTVWTLADGKLPILKNVSGAQSGDGGIYLTERDISKATVVLDSESFVYTGKPIQPGITVTFGGQALIENVDYTVAFTSSDTEDASAGINTGIVTLKISGKGNFMGAQTKTFTIVKATPVKANLQYDLTAVTYTGTAYGVEVSLQSTLSGLGAIIVKYDGSPTKPTNAGEYAVTVEITEGGNFTAAHIELGTFVIKKATGSFVSTGPVSTIHTPTLKLGDISLPTNYVWNSPTTALNAGSGQSHQATYTDPSGNYESVTGSITVNVVKASPFLMLTANPTTIQTRPGSVELTAALPTDATGTLTFRASGDTITTVTLPVRSVAFTPTGEVNTYSFTVEFTGDSNYENKISGALEYSFTKSDQAELNAVDGTVSFGSALDLSSLVSGGSGVGSISFVVTDGPSEISGTTLTPTGVGEINMTVTKAGDYDYNAKSTTFKVMVNPRVTTFTVTPVVAQTHTGSAITPEPEVRDGSVLLTAGVHFTYGYADNIRVGTSATVNIIGIGNYAGSTGSVTFTIGGAIPSIITPPVVSGIVYTGTALSQIPLTGGEASVSGHFVWINPSATAVYGESTYEVLFVPDDTLLYTQVAGISATFTAVNRPTGGGSGGGSSSGSDATTIVQEKQPDQPVTAVVSLTTTAGEDGHALASILESTVGDAIKKATEAAKLQSKTINGIGVSITVNTPANAKSFGLVLTQPVLKQLMDEKVQQIEVNGQLLTLNFNQQAIREIQTQSSSDVIITVKPATVKSVRNAYDITISYVKDGKTVNITSLGSGSVNLSIPCTLGKDEAVGYLYAAYVDAKGKVTRIPGSAYDANSRSMIFATNHFSVYGVGYTAPSAKFTDIGSHWAKESIDYVVGRGLFSGNSTGKFNPDTAITRGDFVTALGRLVGVDTKAYIKSSFTDLEASSYYLSYIEWAYSKNIIQGIGNSRFAPDRAISREEIAVIFANYAKATGYKLPVTQNAITFADASSIGRTHKTAVTAMQQAGIMMGGQNNCFNPTGNTTYAEVSAMLHRYIKLTIDPTTAQGWAKNDDGQYMYYKDSKPLTGWQTIDGAKYFFQATGALQTGWVKDTAGNWYYYSGNIRITGWRDIGKGDVQKTYYFTKDGMMVYGKWLELDDKWYYFYANGSLARSTKVDGYEVDENGVRKTK